MINGIIAGGNSSGGVTPINTFNFDVFAFKYFTPTGVLNYLFAKIDNTEYLFVTPTAAVTNSFTFQYLIDRFICPDRIRITVTDTNNIFEVAEPGQDINTDGSAAISSRLTLRAGLAPGTYTVTFTATGCETKTRTLTVVVSGSGYGYGYGYNEYGQFGLGEGFI